MTDKVLCPLEDCYSDVKLWNSVIKDLKGLDSENAESKWFNTPWLTVECYLYRRIFEALRQRYRALGFHFSIFCFAVNEGVRNIWQVLRE